MGDPIYRKIGRKDIKLNIGKNVPVARTPYAIAWVVWTLFFINSFKYIISPFVEPMANIKTYDWIQPLIISLIIATLIEAAVTILIRYFLLIRPYKNGTYDPKKKFTRFFIVGIIIWLCSNGICIYGPIIYFMSGLYWPHIIFGIIGTTLLIYHSPRMKPFVNNENNKKNVPVEIPWSKIE